MEEVETDPEDTFREEEESDESTEDGQQLSDKGEELSLKNIIYRYYLAWLNA